MIEKATGNLLTADVDALVNTVNTVGVMGKGIALQFKRAFPTNYQSYRAACERGEVRLGAMFVFDTAVRGPRRYIINFPTKGHWRSRSRTGDIEAGLEDLVRTVDEHRISSVAVPPLGCGNGGLRWAEVLPLIETACARAPGVRWVVYPPAGPPPATDMPNATAPPVLSSLRALLLGAVAGYIERALALEPRDPGISELEIQKVAYLLRALGAPLPLRFARGRYGPYSEGLARVLEDMEGHYLTGLGDRSARVTELVPINLTPGTRDTVRAVLADHPDHGSSVTELLRLVQGFEAPHGVELLATVHFAAHQPPRTPDPAELGTRVRSWNQRKATLFTQYQVEVAAQRLADRGLLPS